MKTLNVFWDCLTRSLKLLSFILLLCITKEAQAQKLTAHAFLTQPISARSHYLIQQEAPKEVFPNPGKVLRRSLILPGWGQVTNKQTWKLPIIYGLLGGLTYYSVILTRRYHDYRAAFFNETNNVQDGRFGRTPLALVGENTQLLRSRRDSFRNRRDFIYVTVFLAYVLNVVDAYVYAHLRSFDVSDDLSMNAIIKPEVLTTPTDATLGLSLSFNMFKKRSHGRR